MLPAAAGEEKGDLAGTPRTPAGGLASPCTPLAAAGEEKGDLSGDTPAGGLAFPCTPPAIVMVSLRMKGSLLLCSPNSLFSPPVVWLPAHTTLLPRWVYTSSGRVEMQ